MKNNDKFNLAVERIIEEMESKGNDWVKSWSCGGGMPINFSTKKYYRGINTILLLVNTSLNGYTTNQYLTFKQAKNLGATIKKGSKGCPVFFFSEIEKEDEETHEIESFWVMRSYTVFNVDQVEGLEDAYQDIESFEDTRIDAIEDCLSNSSINIKFEGYQPCYIPSLDIVKMVERKYFKLAESYYSTLFHEMAHATGHKNRLNRNLESRKVDDYAFEELVAEISSIFLSGHFGLDIKEGRHAEYLNDWISILKDNKRVLWKAAAKAQLATDWLLKDMKIDINKNIAA